MNNNEKKGTPEIPDNKPESKEQTIMNKGTFGDARRKKQMKVVKFAYAFAILLALGGMLTAKIATEKALGNLNTPIESDYVTLVPTEVEEIEFEVRQNLEDVPDTRESTTEKKETTKEASTTQSPFAVPFKDEFALPINGKIIKEYNRDTPSFNKTMGDWRTHPGVDIKGAEGEQVIAAAYGTVKKIYQDPMYGTVVEIDHGNSVTGRYCGLEKETLEISLDDTVKEGQTLGFLGVVPGEKDYEPHLHYEIIIDGKHINPLDISA